MSEDNVVSAVCRIPLPYRQPDGKPLQRYVAESGYYDNPEALSVDAVTAFLHYNPTLVDEWFLFSENKRTSGGWYLIEEGNEFIVGQIGGARIGFSDRMAACAGFIVREIGEVTPPSSVHTEPAARIIMGDPTNQ